MPARPLFPRLLLMPIARFCDWTRPCNAVAPSSRADNKKLTQNGKQLEGSVQQGVQSGIKQGLQSGVHSGIDAAWPGSDTDPSDTRTPGQKCATASAARATALYDALYDACRQGSRALGGGEMISSDRRSRR